MLEWCFQPPIVPNISMSEDCLYLNVYTPSNFSSDSNLPVIVGIHGGSLIIGSSYWYANHAHLVTLGRVIQFEWINSVNSLLLKVVVVTMNYRLGVFGWLALSELAVDDPRGTSGNYGLLDQQLALQWIRDNIKYFGNSFSATLHFRLLTHFTYSHRRRF